MSMYLFEDLNNFKKHMGLGSHTQLQHDQEKILIF